MDEIFREIDQSREKALDGLMAFLRFPSISAQDNHAGDCAACADWLANELQQVGLKAQVMPTGGRPAVVAKSPHVAGRPTVLLYGHYDVQPVDPVNQWKTPPFEPTIRDGAIYARGAADDKGQVWAHVQALASWHKHGGLPINLVVLIEGEEEVGSENLERFVSANRELLRADLAVISDTGQFDRGVPAITCGLRGLVYQEIFLYGPSHDLHSGVFGGAVPNPANVLAGMLAKLHDANGRVQIPGFYDDVLELSQMEQKELAALPFDEQAILKDLGLSSGMGEAGYGFLARTWARPTCDINGITAGYQGMGAKTVIPASASAKVSMRLVANQDSAKIERAFQDYIRTLCPTGMHVEIKSHGKGDAVLVHQESDAMRRASRAVEKGFGKKPVMIRSGGSIPVVALIKSVLGIDTLLVGFGLPDDRVHSPNEKFDLDAFYNGTRTAAALWQELAQLQGAK